MGEDLAIGSEERIHRRDIDLGKVVEVIEHILGSPENFNFA
jgi:hypothetical protein